MTVGGSLQRVRVIAFLSLAATLVSSRPLPADVPPGPAAAGQPFDAVPFGFSLEPEGAGLVGVRWAEPRMIRRVVVTFGSADGVPQQLRLQYWHAGWNGRPEPVQAEKGAGGVGWEQMDDWTNGQWKDADASRVVEGTTCTFVFAATGVKEFPDATLGVTYRKTLKLRLVAGGLLPRPERFQAFTDSVYEPLTARILFGKPARPDIQVGDVETGRLEVFNGILLAVRPVGATRVEGQAWSMPGTVDAGIEADILRAADAVHPGYDRTVVTVRSARRPFSFEAGETARGDRILVDDLGVLVTRGRDPITLEQYRRERRERREFAGRTVYSRVFDEPEQTLSAAWDAMPLKRPLYYVHGLPGNRNAMHQDGGGDLRVAGSRHWFSRPVSPRDTARKHWDGEVLGFGLGLPHDEHVNQRALKDGWLPVLTSWYRDGPALYEQITALDKLDGNLESVALDDPTVLLMRIRITNTSASQPATARLSLQSRAGGKAEPMSLDGERVLAEWQGKPRLRALVRAIDASQVRREAGGLQWSRPLAPAESISVDLLVPSITLDRDEEIAPLARRNLATDQARIATWWEGRLSRGSSIHTPEPWLNDFYKAHLQHLLVNCYQEIGSDRLHAHVGTFTYGVYPDESVMMISDLDRRGCHDEARRCYQSFLDAQGSVAMPGNFASKEGTFYGSLGHETGGYNKSHAWVMWGMAEHWWYTRDREWMAKAAPGLIASCDWVTRERQATMIAGRDGPRALDHGFLPTGSLEDVTDYWSWLVTNACTAWGFQALAAALADFGHPEAGRLAAEANAFRDDLVRGFEESRVLAPVVRLRDGTCVPKYPSRLYERGRTHGWLRETLEGSIHLLITGLVDARSPGADWILKDYEDNLYISDEYGYAIPNFDAFWFSRGGFSMQANLLGGPLPYLERDEIKHFLRAYFNAFASAFYPDVRMCNEHSLPELGYPAGDHFKSSDEAQSTYWLRLMFVREAAGDLYLGQAIPRYWLADGRRIGIDRAASHYGPLSFHLESRAAAGEIRATLTTGAFPARPRTIYLRIRHPQSKPIRSVLLDGKPYDRFDAAREWVILPGAQTGKLEVTARY